jgi:hypothetical protein
MARMKSIPGTKTSRAKANQEQADTAAQVPEVNTAGKTPAESASDPIKESKGRPVGSDGGSESKLGSEARRFEVMKPEVTKTDSRKNLVPINLEDEIRRRAYEIYEQRGAISGSEAEDWFTAEREVRQRYRQQSA